MRKIRCSLFFVPLALSFLTAQSLHAMELQTSFLPSYLYRAEGVGVLRADTTLLLGGDYFWFGPYAFYENVSPQATDTSVGAALRIGHEQYLGLEGGAFQRTFTQTGTGTLTGSGYSASLIWGFHVSPHWGASIAATAKRISTGSLEQRTIVDLLPLFSARVEF
jgi:hypothetical protein